MVEPINKRVQFPRDSTQVNDKYIGPSGQVTVDSQRKELRLHDGKTKGGWRIPNLTQLKQMFLSSSSEFANTQFANDLRGFLVRTGDRIYRLREFFGADGIVITNSNGVAGNPTIGLPDRLKPAQPIIDDADDATETGFYIIGVGADSNLPDEWKLTTDVALFVINYSPSTGGTILQVAFNAQNADQTIYFRRKTGILWSAWAKPDYTVDLPIAGTKNELNLGVNDIQRTWSASDIKGIVAAMIESIQYIDGANVAKAFSFNSLFDADGTGPGTSTLTQGAYNFATNDRIEIVAGATAQSLPAGETVTAKVEVERVDGVTWDTISTSTVSSLPNGPAVSTSCKARIIKNGASSYQIVDDNWAVLSTVAFGLSGRIRVTTGAVNEVGARAYRWR